MHAITNVYLTEIIFKKIGATIDQYRASRQHYSFTEMKAAVTDDEVLEFIQSIPYFDEGLKNFLVGNLPDNSLIISQAWENEFIKKTVSWSRDQAWLTVLPTLQSRLVNKELAEPAGLLGLPY